jgi:hypothetical protein
MASAWSLKNIGIKLEMTYNVKIINATAKDKTVRKNVTVS